MRRIVIALISVLVGLTSLAAVSAHAQTTGAASYFCTKNPTAAQCQKPPPVTGGGTTGGQHGHHAKPPKTFPATGAGGTAPIAGSGRVVTGLKSSPAQPSQLPLTGGAVPSTPAGGNSYWLWLSLGALLVLSGGSGLSLAVRRRL